MGWEQEWLYAPTKGAARMHKRVQERIDKALGYLRGRRENDAADAFAAMLADNLTRLEITNAVTRYHLDRPGGVKVRQNDARDLARDLQAAARNIAYLGDKLGRLRSNLDGTPDLPEHEAIARRGCKALQAVYDLAELADDLHRAVIATHGEDKGGRSVSERLTGNPFDHLTDDLARPWRRHGNALDGRGRDLLIMVLRAVHEAETDKEEIPERRVKDRIKGLLENCTPPP